MSTKDILMGTILILGIIVPQLLAFSVRRRI